MGLHPSLVPSWATCEQTTVLSDCAIHWLTGSRKKRTYSREEPGTAGLLSSSWWWLFVLIKCVGFVLFLQLWLALPFSFLQPWVFTCRLGFLRAVSWWSWELQPHKLFCRLHSLGVCGCCSSCILVFCCPALSPHSTQWTRSVPWTTTSHLQTLVVE